MTPDELDSVATFYNLHLPPAVGRHVILLCDSVSCWIMGYETAAGAPARSAWASTSARPPPTAGSPCCPSPAWAPATSAPAMMIDEDLHGDLTPEKIDEILDGYRVDADR